MGEACEDEGRTEVIAVGKSGENRRDQRDVVFPSGEDPFALLFSS